MEQGSAEWFAERLGKATGSRIKDATAKGKPKADGTAAEAAIRAGYKVELVLERVTGLSQAKDLSSIPHIAWGKEKEAYACLAYEAFSGDFVAPVGFVDHPRILMSGASPDGLLDDGAGVLEIKAPNSSTHYEYLRNNAVPATYKKQIMWQIACTQREYGIFVSYDPRLEPKNQLLVVRWVPEKKEILALEGEVEKFLEEVAADELWLRNRAA